MNELLWILFLIIDFFITIIIFIKYKKEGLFVLIAINIILCNIQVLKLINMFGMTLTLGNILYGSIYFSTDLLSEFYGKKEAFKGVIFGFIAIILMTLYMQLSLLFIPAPDDFIHNSLNSIFSIMPRIALASILAYIVSQFHDVWAFHFYKIKTKGKYLWLRNNLSTLVSQFIDSIIFVFIAFWGIFDTKIFISILFTTYIIKVIIALLDTPFIYIASYFYKKQLQ